MTNKRAEIWSGIMVLATSALTLLPKTSLFFWPVVALTILSVVMLVYTLSKRAKEKADKSEKDTTQI